MKKIKRFGDARDEYLTKLEAGDRDAHNPCTSKNSLSTMPRRQR